MANKVDVPDHIGKRIEELLDIKDQMIGRINAIEGGIAEMKQLHETLTETKPKKPEIEENRTNAT